jgi:hypothetical protein
LRKVVAARDPSLALRMTEREDDGRRMRNTGVSAVSF